MHEPTPDLVRRFAAFLAVQVGARFVDKRTAPEMRAFAYLFGRLGAFDQEWFIEHIPTTVGTRVYLPFEPGLPSAHWPLWAQMVALARECQTVLKFRQEGTLRSYWQRMTREEERIRVELESFLCHLEMHVWRYRALPSIKDLTRTLRKFQVREVLVEFSEAMLRVAGESVKQGAVVSDVGKMALPWLTRHADSIRAKAGS